jgi:transcription termination factor Rho
MSPRPRKKTDADATSESAVGTEAPAQPAAPKKRGRPRKNPLPVETEAGAAAVAERPANGGDGTAVTTPRSDDARADTDAPAAPRGTGNGARDGAAGAGSDPADASPAGRRPRRGRPAGSRGGAERGGAERDGAERDDDALGRAGPDGAEPELAGRDRDGDGADGGAAYGSDVYGSARAGAVHGGAERGEDVDDGRPRRDGDGRDGDGREADGRDGDGRDGDGRDVDGREGRDRQQRSRRNRGGQRKAGMNYRDLQGKIVPELHLLAKEVGLDAFREMAKDDLVQAILERSTEAEGLRLVNGYLEISSDGYGFLQESLLHNNTRSVIVSAGLIKQFKLRTGDAIMGKARRPRDNERYGTLIRVEAVNGVDPFQAAKRPRFDDLVPTFPDRRIKLESGPNELSARVIDLLAPIGRGQRGLIVAPPKAGKTTLLKAIAKSVVTNEPEIKVIVLLVDERPEEVTDFRESVQGVEVVASTFDEPPANHIRVAEFVHERARRIVEDGGHIMILLDSITRLARANNLVTPATGRTLSGGLDSNALHWPKRFLGAARNIRGGGSLSILATALVETGSRMDDVIFEEFKGTGNMELHLSRRLEERRIFPAIDILKSGTRREDLLLGEDVLAKMWLLRKVISDMDASEAMEMLLSRLNRTKDNGEFLSTLGHG